MITKIKIYKIRYNKQGEPLLNCTEHNKTLNKIISPTRQKHICILKKISTVITIYLYKLTYHMLKPLKKGLKNHILKLYKIEYKPVITLLYNISFLRN